MENNEIISLWKAYGKRLDESLRLSRQNTQHITQIKVQSFLSAMRPLKVFAVLAGIIWVILVDSLIIRLAPVANLFFLVSAAIQVILTKLAIGIYLYQLILIHQTDISEPVVATQRKLAALKASTLWGARLLFLQLPVWTTFYWNETMLANGHPILLTIQAAVSLSMTMLAIWLFFNIRYRNRDKKWFRLIFAGKEWTPVLEAIGILNEVQAFQREDN
ncbi:hypothetical protein EGT74_14530 [Chitinophaga lutea]|uniref:Uncharacterized protein n=1 Tax=Chitinophaga lutea TaxID=2488634 RepID=A0A3N4Q978_9BACT|nr:hypothetical protein [Chitinophaga lutea]RPE08274.1 hypothetical protein EGT74_14530 [Chitinophaga lutea]